MSETSSRIPRCGLCHQIVFPQDAIVRTVDEDSPLTFFAEEGVLRVHPRCVIEHHEALTKELEDWT